MTESAPTPIEARAWKEPWMPQQGEAMVILLPRLGKGSQKAAQSGVSGTKATSSWILSSSSGVLGPWPQAKSGRQESGRAFITEAAGFVRRAPHLIHRLETKQAMDGDIYIYIEREKVCYVY